jgi:hypothetical protein
MRGFVALSDAEINAMLTTVEALFRRGHELVVGTYDYLLHNHETAAILGWENGADPTHLAERRRFFTSGWRGCWGWTSATTWRTISFRAGKLHAAHGPRRTHVPPIYVTGSISLVNATFARFIMEEMPGHPQAPLALAGWNKVLTHAPAPDADGLSGGAGAGSAATSPSPSCSFGRMRTVTGAQNLPVHVTEGGAVQHALRKFFNYYPPARSEVFDVAWAAASAWTAHGTPWFVANRQYRGQADVARAAQRQRFELHRRAGAGAASGR